MQIVILDDIDTLLLDLVLYQKYVYENIQEGEAEGFSFTGVENKTILVKTSNSNAPTLPFQVSDMISIIIKLYFLCFLVYIVLHTSTHNTKHILYVTDVLSIKKNTIDFFNFLFK